MNYAEVEAASKQAGLAVFGAFHTVKLDKAPKACKTLIMLGPDEPRFWQRITNSPEFAKPDPVDHWSTRVVDQLASDLNASAIFPFGGPPFQPFVSWALRTGRVWQSPITLMVHDKAGLFLSFRGALAFNDHIELPQTKAASPCVSCATKPCLTACPPSALNKEGYDLAACHTWLNEEDGKSCISGGCHVRRSCPISQSYGRLKEQSAHHMRAFHKG